MKRFTFGILTACFLLGGCAHKASNGGGHVVGNPMMPAEYSKPAGDECGCGETCGCEHVDGKCPCMGEE